jgi:hypothetical protein
MYAAPGRGAIPDRAQPSGQASAWTSGRPRGVSSPASSLSAPFGPPATPPATPLGPSAAALSPPAAPVGGGLGGSASGETDYTQALGHAESGYGGTVGRAGAGYTGTVGRAGAGRESDATAYTGPSGAAASAGGGGARSAGPTSSNPLSRSVRSWNRNGLKSSFHNPFIIILLCAGGALVLLGSGMYLHAYVGFDDAGFVSQATYISAEAYMQVGPQLAMLGIATLVGVGFVLAVRWQPDRDNDDTADISL